VAQGPAKPGLPLLLGQQPRNLPCSTTWLEFMQVLTQQIVFTDQMLLLLKQGLQALPELGLKHAGEVLQQGLHGPQLCLGSGQLPLQLLG